MSHEGDRCIIAEMLVEVQLVNRTGAALIQFSFVLYEPWRSVRLIGFAFPATNNKILNRKLAKILQSSQEGACK